MGMYDSFEVKDFKCNNCNNTFTDYWQTKDFRRFCDTYSEGENVDDLIDTWFFHKWIDEPTIEQSKNKLKYYKNRPKQYRVYDYTEEPDCVDKTPIKGTVYKYIGKTRRVCYGIKNQKFNLYTGCPQCHAWLDTEHAEIKDSIYVGIPDRSKVIYTPKT